MRLVKYITLIALSLTCFQTQAQHSEYRDFLIRLGFKDYSAEIEKTLSSGKKISEVSREVLLQNKERYQIINDARELTANLIESLGSNLNKSGVQETLIRLSTFLLSPHPLISLEKLPDNILKLKGNKDEFLKAREVYLVGLAHERAQSEKEYLLKILADLIPEMLSNSALFDNIDFYLTDYVSRDYSDLGLQQTRYWGRALVASLVRYSRMNVGSKLENKLSTTLRLHNIFLENFISNNLTYTNATKQTSTMTLYNGDIANEYSRGTESYQITVGVVPGDSANSKLAEKSNLLGKKRMLFSYPMEDEEAELKLKARAQQELTQSEKEKLDLISVNGNQEGFSHTGLVEIKKDLETNIQMSWIWDVYPSATLGGVRFIGAEGFAFPANYQKIGFVHYSPAKFRKFYKNQIAQRGFLPKVWKSYLSKLNRGENSAEPVEDRSSFYEWSTHISKEEVFRLADNDSTDAKAWFEQEIAPRILNTVESYMTSAEALVFTTPFVNAQNMVYCSQLIVLAFLQGVNVDAEATFDSWSALTKMIKRLHLPGTENIDLSRRIIAPAGFAWQSQLVDNFSTVRFDQTQSPRSFDAKIKLLGNWNDVSPRMAGKYSLNLKIDVNDNDY
ncbi:MAG: hypothetical protein ACXVCY_09545 [Pseudobdellovibrionaceae bacterium]